MIAHNGFDFPVTKGAESLSIGYSHLDRLFCEMFNFFFLPILLLIIFSFLMCTHDLNIVDTYITYISVACLLMSTGVSC